MTETVKSLPAVSRAQPPAVDVFADPAAFDHAQRVAKVFASSNLVPKHLQGNVADCLIAYQVARRLNEEPLTVFQNIYVVSGKPGWTTAYCIARANKSGVFKDRIHWTTTGADKTLAVKAHATLADGTPVEVECDMRMAIGEGWVRNQKYTTMPEHMLRWRSAAMLIRLYCPEVMLGMPVLEELETMPQQQMREVSEKTTAQSFDDFVNELPPAAQTSDQSVDPTTGEILDAPQESIGQEPAIQADAGGAAAARGAATSEEDSEIRQKLQAGAAKGTRALRQAWAAISRKLSNDDRMRWHTILQNEFLPLAEEADKQLDIFPGDRE